MTAPTHKTLDATVAAAARLGMDIAGEADTLRQFLDGPSVLAVVGVANQERTALAAALAEKFAVASVREHEPVPDVSNQLWDVLILVTPADRVLSRAEEALVRTAAEQRQPALVVVSRVSLLGTGAERATGVRELERFRLRPALGALDVRWFFDDGVSESRTVIFAEIAGLLRRVDGHQRAGQRTLRRLLDQVIGGFGELLESRARDRAMLDDLATLLPSQLANIAEQTRTVRLAIADRLRAAEDAVYDATLATAETADEWVMTRGLAPWADVERPVLQAWAALQQTAFSVLNAYAERFRASLTHIVDDITTRVGQLDLDPPALALPEVSWSTAAVEAGLELLATVDLGPALKAFADEVAALLPSEPVENQDQTQDEDQEPGTALQRAVGAGRRVVDTIQHHVTGSPVNSLSTRLHNDVRIIVQARVRSAREAILAAAGAGIDAEMVTAGDEIRGLVAWAAEAIDRRYQWYGAYGELLDLRAQY